jgi:hypothetical protein
MVDFRRGLKNTGDKYLRSFPSMTNREGKLLRVGMIEK